MLGSEWPFLHVYLFTCLYFTQAQVLWQPNNVCDGFKILNKRLKGSIVMKNIKKLVQEGKKLESRVIKRFVTLVWNISHANRSFCTECNSQMVIWHTVVFYFNTKKFILRFMFNFPIQPYKVKVNLKELLGLSETCELQWHTSCLKLFYWVQNRRPAGLIQIQHDQTLLGQASRVRKQDYGSTKKVSHDNLESITTFWCQRMFFS